MALHVEGIAGSAAGNIVGVGGIDTVVFKIATLSNVPCCPTFSPIQFKVIIPGYAFENSFAFLISQCHFSKSPYRLLTSTTTRN